MDGEQGGRLGDEVHRWGSRLFGTAQGRCRTAACCERRWRVGAWPGEAVAFGPPIYRHRPREKTAGSVPKKQEAEIGKQKWEIGTPTSHGRGTIGVSRR